MFSSKNKINFTLIVACILGIGAISFLIGYKIGITRNADKVATEPIAKNDKPLYRIPDQKRESRSKSLSPVPIILPNNIISSKSIDHTDISNAKFPAMYERKCKFEFLTIDERKVSELMDGLNSEDVEKKIASIEFFGKYGSSEIIDSLRRLIYEDNDPRIRSTAVLALNWENNPDELMRIYMAEKDSTVKEAVISAVDNTDVDYDTMSRFNKLLIESLDNEHDNGVINRILSHVTNDDDPTWSISAYSILLSQNYNNNNMTSEVIEHMADLAKGSSVLTDMFANMLDRY